VKEPWPLSYDAAAIQVLEGLDAVRKRPGMYIGSTGERGLHHLVYEVVDNSVDEALAGHATRIEVVLQADGGVRVEDDGRGIPVDEHPIEKKPALEVVLTVLHAGGKFGGASSGYSVSGGLHGVGVSVVNALAEWLEVEVSVGGEVFHQRYEQGKTRTALKEIGKRRNSGTTVTFRPDPEIFTEGIEFSFEASWPLLKPMVYSLPPRRTVHSRSLDSALTTDTPTPCRPPEKL